MNRAQFEAKYFEQNNKFQHLKVASQSIIESCLLDIGIAHLPVVGRLKTIESLWTKHQKKRYSDPFSEITDFVGFRIVVFLERDIEVVSKRLKDTFEIDAHNSIDKLNPSSPNTVGYRSLHLICSLGHNRAKLPEYSGVTDLRFEIQIRTVLQHAWAEIEHQRNYKGTKVLPPELQRRLMIIAGTLELVDKEFSNISSDADHYKDDVATNREQRKDDLLSTISLDVVLHEILAEKGTVAPKLSQLEDSSEAIEELNDFGIYTIGDFAALIDSLDNDMLDERLSSSSEETLIGLVRDLMMASDVRKYFKKSHKSKWQGMSNSDLEFVSRVSGQKDLRDFLADQGIIFYDDGEWL